MFRHRAACSLRKDIRAFCAGRVRRGGDRDRQKSNGFRDKHLHHRPETDFLYSLNDIPVADLNALRRSESSE